MSKTLYIDVTRTMTAERMPPTITARRKAESDRFHFLRLDDLRASHFVTPIEAPTISETAKMTRALLRTTTRGLSQRIGGFRGSVTFPVTTRGNFADFLARRGQPVIRDGERYDTLYKPAEIAAAFLRPAHAGSA